MGVYEIEGRRFRIEGDTPTPEEQKKIEIKLGRREPDPGIVGAFTRNFGTFDEQVARAGGMLGAFAANKLPSVFGDEDEWWKYVDEKSQEIAREGWQPETGVLDSETWYDSIRALSAAAGNTAPATAIGLGGMIATLPIGGVGAAAAGIGLGALAAAPQTFAENVDAQRADDGEVDSWGKAFLGTALNSVIEATTDKILVGMAGKVSRSLVLDATKSGVAKAMQRLQQLSPEVAKVAATGAVQGGVEEALQSAITRWQADQPLMSDEAKKQYLEAAVTGAILEGAMGGGLALAGKPIEKRMATMDARANDASDAFIQRMRGIQQAYRDVENDPAYIRKAASDIDLQALTQTPLETAYTRPDITEADYVTKLEAVRNAPEVSRNFINNLAGSEEKGKALLDIMTRRGDLRVSDRNPQFFTPTTAKLKDYVVAPFRKPSEYMLESDKVTGTFPTKKEALAAAKAAGVEKYNVVEQPGEEQHGVYELTYNDAGGIVGKRLLETHQNKNTAEDALAQIDPLYSGGQRGNSYYKRKAATIAEQERRKLEQSFGEMVQRIAGPKLKAFVVNRQQDIPGARPDTLVEGVSTRDEEGNPLIMAATNFIDPGKTVEEKQEFINSIGHHEIIHGMRTMGMISDAEFKDLVRATKNRFSPGRKSTYFDQASALPAVSLGGTLPGTPEYSGRIEEEAVAEMFRDYMRNPHAFPVRQRNIIQKLLDLVLRSIGFDRTDRGYRLLKDIEAGKLASREPGSVAPQRLGGIGSEAFSMVPVPIFYMKSAKALQNIPMKKGTAQQWSNALRKQGVKPDEINWIGVEQLPGEITKEELGDHIKAHNLIVEEKVMGGKLVPEEERQRLYALEYDARDRYSTEYRKIGEDYNINIFEIDNFFAFAGDDIQHPLSKEELNIFSEKDFIIDSLLEEARLASKTILRNDGNYDAYVRLSPFYIARRDARIAYNKVEPAQYSHMISRGSKPDVYKVILYKLPQLRNKLLGMYTQPHWHEADEIDTLMHTRVTERMEGNRKTLRIEEMQSDLVRDAERFGDDKVVSLSRQLREEVKNEIILKAKSYDLFAKKMQEQLASGVEQDILDERINNAKHHVVAAISDQIWNMPESPAGVFTYHHRDGGVTFQIRSGNSRGSITTWPQDKPFAEWVEQMLDLETVEPAMVAKPPLMKSWQEYVFKRLIRYAAEEGLDEISWPGTPEAVSAVEWGGAPLKLTKDDRGNNVYKVHGTNVTKIVNYYTTTLPKIAQKIAQQFGTTAQLDSAIVPTTEEKIKNLRRVFLNKDDVRRYADRITDKIDDLKNNGIWYDKISAEHADIIRKARDTLDVAAFESDYLGYIAEENYVSHEDVMSVVSWAVTSEPSFQKNPAMGILDKNGPDIKMFRMPISDQLREFTLKNSWEMFSRVPNPQGYPDGTTVEAMPVDTSKLRILTPIDEPDVTRNIQTPEFKRWFGDSKVVDELGKPQVVFHGTQSSFDYFGRGPRRSAGGQMNPLMDAHFFSDSPKVASDYADMRVWDSNLDRTNALLEGKAPNIVPAYMSLQNPKIIDAAGKSWWNTKDIVSDLYNEYTKFKTKDWYVHFTTRAEQKLPAFYRAKDNNVHDGVIILNSLDNFKDDQGEPAHVYVAFDAQQIKSKYNVGTFDPNKLNIRYSAVPTTARKMHPTIPHLTAGHFTAYATRYSYYGDNAKTRDMINKAKRYDQGLTSYGEPLTMERPKDSAEIVWSLDGDKKTPIAALIRNPTTDKKEPVIVFRGGEWVRDGALWPSGFGMRHAQWHFQQVRKDLRTDDPQLEIIKALRSYGTTFVMEKGRLVATAQNPKWVRPLTIVLEQAKSPFQIGSIKKGDTIWHLVTAFTNNYRDTTWASAVPMPSYALTPIGARVAPLSVPEMERYVSQLEYDVVSKKLKRTYEKMRMPSEWRKKADAYTDRFVELFQDKNLSIAQLMDRVRKMPNAVVSAFSDAYREISLTSGIVDAGISANKYELFEPLIQKIKALNVSQASIDDLLNTVPKIDAERAAAGAKLGWDPAALQMDAEHAAIKMVRHYENNDQAALEMVLYALHAPEANAAYRIRNERYKDERVEQYEYGSGMTDTEAGEIMAWAKAQPWWPQMEQEVVPAFKKVIKNTNMTRIRGGIGLDYTNFVDENGNIINIEFENYAPLRGRIDEDIIDDLYEANDVFARAGKGFSIRGKEDFSRTGRQSLAANLLDNALLQNMEAIMRVQKNRVGQTVKQLIEDNQAALRDTAEIIHRLPLRPYYDARSGRVKLLPDHRLAEDLLWVKEYAEETVEREDGTTFQRPYIKATGIKIHDPRIKRALTGQAAIGNAGMSGMTRLMLRINRFLGSTRTSWNPNFIIPNLVRDIQTAGLTVSEYEMNGMVTQIMKDAPKAFKGFREWSRNPASTDEWAAITAEFVKYGGKTAVEGLREVQQTIEDIQKGFDAALKPETTFGKGMGAAQKVFKVIDHLNDSVENMTRIAVYRTVRDKFMDDYKRRGIVPNEDNIKKQAAYAARNATVDFNRGGELKAFMSAYSLFFNASMQGTMTLVNVFLRSSKARKVFGAAIMAGFLQDVIMSALSDDDDYDKINDYVLEHNIVVANPYGGGYLTMPIPYFFNAFYNFGRALSRGMRGGYTPGQAINSAMGTMLDAVNPLGWTSFYNFVAPTIADPFIDLMRNENFMGSPIQPAANPFGIDERASRRYFNNTSGIYTWPTQLIADLTGGKGDYIEGALEMSPNMVEYLAEYMLAGTLTFGQQIADLANPFSERGSLVERILSGDKWTPLEIPVIRRFAGTVSEREDLGAYLDNRDRIMRISKSYTNAIADGNVGLARGLRDEYPEELAAAEVVKKVEARRKKISQAINSIRDNASLSSEQKREMIRRLREEQDDLVGVANRFFGDM